MQQLIKNEFKEHIKAFDLAMRSLIPHIEIAANLCIDCINNDGKILLIGNGGSAADAQHIAAELVGRYKVDRKAISAIALTTDSSIITAVSNDFGFSHVFDRQIEALANTNDVIIGISTSGNSENIISGLKVAKKIGCKTIVLSGNKGGQLKEICNSSIIVPSIDTARIQEIHIFIGHTLCTLIEDRVKN
ncbi:D-sedoheptulose 7-phosphate isomerase [Candidatus Pseudothioglobus sp. Uisw_086]|jgi:D-sedoheptulose 7-phosphate isomerase|uniref:D-sedoheptulose 7-phosphate isomerase n=1 Tax=Candidatus Pseudothioglobus sp. Uisw_086 TaxID=3230998 RepID=UPI003A85E3CE